MTDQTREAVERIEAQLAIGHSPVTECGIRSHHADLRTIIAALSYAERRADKAYRLALGCTTRGMQVERERERDTALAQAERAALIEQCARAAEAQDRTGYEWVRDSVWDNILKRAGANVRALLNAPDPVSDAE